MSHSRKRFAVVCWIGNSQKQGKRKCNRKFRRSEHMAISSDLLERLPYVSREVMSPWDLGGDGKRYHRLLSSAEVYRHVMGK